jgi:SpoVK/Ycf46/Vps4 family AAA+-type ATPase
MGKNNKELVLNFKNFLDFLDRNEKELKTNFLNITAPSYTWKFDSNKRDGFLHERTPLQLEQTENVLANFENAMKKNFHKILLQNYLQKQNNKTLFHKKLSLTLLDKKLNFNSMIDSTIFLNISKVKSLHPSYFEQFNYNTKWSKTTNNLILLEKWKSLLKTKSLLNVTNNSEKNQKVKSNSLKNLTNLSEDNLIQEIYLYRQFDKICEKLCNFVLWTNETDNETNKTIKNGSSKSLFKYTTPILASSLDKPLNSLTTLDLNLTPDNSYNSLLEKRMKQLWFENGLKKSSFQNTFSLFHAFMDSYKKENETSKDHKLQNLETKKSILKNFLLHQKLNLNVLPMLKIEKLNQLAALDQQSKTQVLNQFLITKKYDTFNHQKMYTVSLQLKNNNLFLSSPLDKKSLALHSFVKLKKQQNSFLPSSWESSNNMGKAHRRKKEKIFRTYLSVKALKDKQQKFKPFSNKQAQSELKFNVYSNKSTFQKVRPIFEKLKNKVKAKNVLFRNIPQQKRFSVMLLKNESNKQLNSNNFLTRSEFSGFINYLQASPSKIYKGNRSLETNVGKHNKNLLSFLESSNLEKLYLKNQKNKIAGYSYFSQNFLNNLASFNYLKKADFLESENDLTRFEKKKNLEKKRRLKKLKLENRRRKKRKRFYPRPNYLRFNLYSQFLQKRYFQKFYLSATKTTKNKVNQTASDFCLSSKKESRSRVKKTNRFYTEKPVTLFKQKIYRQQTEAWGTSSANNFQLEKASLKQFSDLLTKPLYYQKEFYKISNETLTEFERLCWKSYWLRSNLKPYIRRIQENLKNMQKRETFKNSDMLFSHLTQNLSKQINPFSLTKTPFLYSKDRQNLKNVAPFYLNIQESLTTSTPQTYPVSLFKKIENASEYERLLYDRITEEIKNVKSQLNVDGQTQPRSYKTGRQKLQTSTPKMLFEAFHKFQNNYFEPNIQGIALNSATIKPLGNLPTLRVLWACHKTNLFTYKENNYSKQIWALYKQREQTKNNKTKKFVSKIFKLSPFQSKNLQNLSESKTRFATQKVQLFGGFIYGANYHTYLRNLKFKLQKTPTVKTNLYTDNSFHLTTKNKLTEETKQWFETNLDNKLQKRVIHFWWSSQNPSSIENKVPFFMFSPFIFSNFSEYLANNSNKQITNHNFEAFSQKDKFNLVLDNTFITTSFWIACCLFHLAIFFTVIRIPEIRSLLKFQFLILSKIANVYLMGVFAIYDLLKNYQTKLKMLGQKTFSSSTPLNNEFNKSLNSLNFQKTRDFNVNEGYFQMSNRNLTIRNSKNGTSKVFLKKVKGVKPIQSTLTFDFYARNTFKLTENPLKNTSASSTLKKLGNINSLLKTSVHPVFSHSNRSLDSKVSSKIVFDSWYTGFLWYRFDKILNKQKLLTLKEKYVKNFKQTLQTSQLEKTSLKVIESNSKNLQLNLKIQSILSLVVLSMTKLTVQFFYISLSFLSKILLTGIDIMESILLLFYKFLEKPAELMVAWIADIFLIEWSSDITTYIPEAFDRDIWISVKKGSRSTRFIGSLPFGFLMQRMILNSTEIFYSWLVKPDSDLLTRQKKGVIFWDIWAEILIQAAETYKMNLSSLNSVKEEQELLIENLLEEKQSSKTENSKNVRLDSKSPEKSKTFLNSQVFKDSLVKMEPLTKYLQEFPTNPSLKMSESKIALPIFKNLLPSTNVTGENLISLSDVIKMEQDFSMDLFKSNAAIETSKRWAVNQYLTTQGRDTDLFMDIHPPKSFTHIRFLKTYLPAQEILSSIVCDIYAGLFPQRVSKNILIVGAPGSTKGFFIQALAGETELKIVTDNAHRYAFVNGGVPIGMKLLRDVFDSLALHTPCLFLLEDIHIIGERRPMLISDDELSKTKDYTFGAEQEEVHEKNRLLYQFSRHALSHYKKPYKGDFSTSIPTNHFSYDLFLGVQPPRKRASDLTAKSPLSMAQIDKVLTRQEGMDANNVENQKSVKTRNNLSFLQLSMEQFFAPPATSPFSILLMKEQKKLKPKKVVKEMPWSGLSYDQFMLISKSQYSVRVKVALLAETAMTNLSIKLDMITDLLVIIDSVRSNRGFVVFATTHLPALLDPALRRPGRFDETLSLPLLPNLMTRFEIFKTTLSSYTTTTDFFDLSLFTSKQKQNENEISLSLSKALLLLLNTKNFKQRNIEANLLNFPVFSNFFNDYSIYSISQAFQTTISQNSLLLNTTKLKHILNLNLHSRTRSASPVGSKNFPQFVGTKSNKQNLENVSKLTLSHLLKVNSRNINFAGNDKLNYISLSYGQAGQFLVESLMTHDFKTYSTKFLMSKNPMEEFDNYEQSVFQTLYSSNIETKNTLLKLFAGKISEFFVLNHSNHYSTTNVNQASKFIQEKQIETLKSSGLTDNKNNLSFTRKNRWFSEQNLLQTNPSQSALFENVENFQGYWQSALSFLDGLAQKRYLYNKNAIVSKMLFFEDNTSLREPPSPPNSSILMPAKKFENYKRTLKDFIQKPMVTIQEKLQIHQKQRFLKLLYNIPVQTSFPTFSQSTQNLSLASLAKAKYSLGSSSAKTEYSLRSSTNFYTSFKELGYLDLVTLKPTSSYLIYKNRFLTRQRFSFLNQWWNGQLAEHNVETTYLSHVDWRSMFVQSLGDLVIDFPDADQYYNPKQRRWYLNSSSWAYWLDFEKTHRTEISQHSILQCFTKTSHLLNENRELFDYLAFRFLRYHQLKEFDLLQTLVRFYKMKDC